MAGQRLITGMSLLVMLLLGGCGGTDFPSVDGSAPANGATAVPLSTTEIRISANRPLYSTKVNGSTVIVNETLGTTHSMPGTVSYDSAAQAIIFKPARLLAAGASYTVTLNGIVDIDGNGMATSTLTFATVINPQQRTVNFSSTGQIAGYTERSYDAARRLTSIVDYTGAGQDGIWFTPDDVASNYEQSSYDARGNLVRLVSASAINPGGNVAGPDGILFTGDDLIVSYLSNTYDGGNHLIRSVTYTGPGPDISWFTADDTALTYTTFSYSQGQRVRAITYGGVLTNAAGPDGILFTADDVITGRMDFANNGTGQVTRTTFYAAGPDGIWVTADDTITGYTNNGYDGFGNQIFLISMIGPGPDGTWFNADDEVGGYNSTPTAGNGNLLSNIDFVGPGTDGIWFTADDVVSSVTKRVTYTYDTLGRVARQATLDAGSDGIAGNADDQGIWSSYLYDDNGLLLRRLIHTSAGSDGIWLSSDDPVSSYADYTYDLNDNTLTETIRDAGPDGTLFNADDRVVSSTNYLTGF